MKVNVSELDEAVLEIIQKQAAVVLESGDLSRVPKKKESERRIAECEKQINFCLERLQNVYEQFVLNEINCDDYTAQKNECSAQIDKLNNQLAIFKQAERDKSAHKKVTAVAKTALSETATPHVCRR